MKTTLTPKNALDKMLKIYLLLILLLAGTHLAYAQCPHPKDEGCSNNFYA